MQYTNREATAHAGHEARAGSPLPSPASGAVSAGGEPGAVSPPNDGATCCATPSRLKITRKSARSASSGDQSSAGPRSESESGPRRSVQPAPSAAASGAAASGAAASGAAASTAAASGAAASATPASSDGALAALAALAVGAT